MMVYGSTTYIVYSFIQRYGVAYFKLSLILLMLSSIGDKCFSGSFTLSHDITYCSNLLVRLTAVCSCQSKSAYHGL